MSSALLAVRIDPELNLARLEFSSGTYGLNGVTAVDMLALAAELRAHGELMLEQEKARIRGSK